MYQSLQSTLSLTAMSDGLYAVNTHSILCKHKFTQRSHLRDDISLDHNSGWESIVHLHDRTYVQSMRCCIHLSVLFIGVFLSSLVTVSIEFICYRHAIDVS
jgi:hypothetical protein